MTENKQPAVRLDPNEWEEGYTAGITGKTGQPPHGLAYSSGLIEGRLGVRIRT